MFEYHYSIDIIFLGKSLDPTKVTSVIGEYTPSRTKFSGKPAVRSDGTVVGDPERASPLGSWTAPLHNTQKIFSGKITINDFLEQHLITLQKYQQFFEELPEDVCVIFYIGLFPDDRVISLEILPSIFELCGKLGISFEMNILCAESGEAFPGRVAGDKSPE